MLIDAVIVLMFVKKLFLIQRTKIEIIPFFILTHSFELFAISSAGPAFEFCLKG